MRVINDRAHRLQIKSESIEPTSLEITVEDAGTGIEPESRDRIFEAFFTTKSNGMGMGLAICRLVIEAHGGTLSASPVIPHGTVFRFTLPGAA
jgi:signal transduction histidine kinase